MKDTKLSLNTDMGRTSRWKYVYCIALSKMNQDFGTVGINDEEVYTIHFKDLAALVSSSTEKLYEIVDHGIAHHKVIETAAERFTIVPMAFGQVATEEDVKAFLSSKYDDLKDIIDRLDGKVELGLKATWKMQAALSDIAVTSDRVRELKAEIGSKQENDTYSARIELGRIVREELEERGKRIASEIYQTLLPLAADSKINDPLRAEMILNSAFLVESAREEEFDKTVETIEGRFGDKISFKYVSSPPYDFVDLNIGE